MDIHVRKLVVGLAILFVMIHVQMLALKDVQELVQPHVTVVQELVLEVVIIIVKILVIIRVLKDVLADVRKLVWDYVLLLVV